MSKKYAAGSNLIILDVKAGRGAFMATEAEATLLAETLCAIGKKLARPVTAVVTDMDQPLGSAVGHTLEVIEAVETLKGNGPPDLLDLCLTLGSHALLKAGKVATETEGRLVLSKLIDSGAALAKFAELIAAQNGNAKVIDDYSLMPQAALVGEYKPKGGGKRWVKAIDSRMVAHACKLMGAGRAQKGDSIDLAVGLRLTAKIGTELSNGQPLATIYAESQAQYEAATAALDEAFSFSEEPVPRATLIKQAIY